MKTKHVVAAFAFANGDVRRSYETLYSEFKNYYAKQHGKWDALDLAFVFCVHRGFPELDHFCSEIETDVYFCRKFVVPLVAPIDTSLSRLPFLPLMPAHGGSLRPASAQTFLQQCGMPAILAKFLVVQHERSPEGIVEDCMSGKFGQPRHLIASDKTSVIQAEQSTEPVRLEKVEIKNFRAYRKLQVFTLGADITVLYGPNGFGKTSFFDAVDFAVTGGIGRMEPIQKANFAKTARHLDSQSEESTVSLSFSRKGSGRKVIRSVDNQKQALLDGRPTDRKTILTEMTGGDIPGADRVENFVSLFRASHLFNQEHQELTRDFQDDCRLSADIVSRMLAFQDYANAVNKSIKVREVLETAISDANQKVQELSKQIAADRKELERLSQSSKLEGNVEEVNKAAGILRSELAAAGITVEPRELDIVAVRGWRAVIESRYAESQNLSARLSVLAKEVANLPWMRTEITAAQQQLAQKELALNEIEEKKRASEEAVQNTERWLSKLNASRVEEESRAGFLEWVRSNKPIYVQLLQQQNKYEEKLRNLTAELSLRRRAEETAIGDLRRQEVFATQMAKNLKTYRAQLGEMWNLQRSGAQLRANCTRLDTIAQVEQTDLNTLNSLKIEEKTLSPQLTAVMEEESRLNRQIAETDKNLSELKALLSQLQAHIQTGICPLCGEDHGSKARLLHRIRESVATDAASNARALHAGVREQVKHLTEQIAANRHKQQVVIQQLGSLKKERAVLEDEIGQFKNAAAKLNIAVDVMGSAMAEQVKAQIERLQRDIADADRQNQELGIAIETARKAAATSKSNVAAKNTEVIDCKRLLASLQEEIPRLRSDPRLTQISLDIEETQLFELKRLNVKRLSEIKAEAMNAETEATRGKQEVSRLRQETMSLKTQLSTVRSQLANLQKSFAQIAIQLEEVKVPPDANENTLLSLIAEQSHIQADLLTLRDSTSNLELVIDAATTSAALTTLLNTLRNREKSIAQSSEKNVRIQPWLKYFEEASRLVSFQQNQAIANFTRQYGPLTSVIQRRLRSVYGFDDISIRSSESTITVRVKRHGEELRPTDYFSQSQQQTLLLGLFLTACSSQTWSAFSPVFLDDPVTHFDDLNTYAFLDLIVGLLDSDIGKRQFIISTCDERLFQLSRQKFRHLAERATFYRFSAIGPDGPTINQIVAPLV
jgi:exonuclease SbcC